MPQAAPNLRLLHFADAHIDIANYGKHDPETGLPVRVMDFLRALDEIVEAAISEGVDLVLFAGDAYKDRNPQPTFQREWGQRIMRLSQAGIPTILLVGNHDMAPATGRAHTMQEFHTLAVPHIHLADDFCVLGPDTLGVPAQVVAIPWASRSKLMRFSDMAGKEVADVYLAMEEILAGWLDDQLNALDPNLPTILLAHTSVQGAQYGSERAVMLGQELTLSGSIVRDKRLDYVALGHIHKHQDFNAGRQPPVVYPGSIERIDFGEAREEKGYVLAEVRKGHTNWRFCPLPTRQFIDLSIELDDAENFMADIMRQLPPAGRIKDAICRVRLSYPHDWETLLDEVAIYNHFAGALSIQIQKLRDLNRRTRLGDTVGLETLTPTEMLALYWQTQALDQAETEALQSLAKEMLGTGP